MGQQTINIGSAPDDGTGDTLRDAGQKINENFTEVYAALVPVGAIVMWSGTIAAAGALSPAWEICDGTANAPGPDLRDKFIVGANQDDGGVAKTNVEGSLKQSGGVTGVSHSAHANLTHAGAAVGDHTGLTHGLSIANHPDLTHAALSHPAMTITHADHSVPSFSGTDASHAAISVPSGSIASRADLSAPTLAVASLGNLSQPSRAGVASAASGTNRSVMAPSFASAANISMPSQQIASHAVSMPSLTIASANNGSAPSQSHTHAAITLAHADHSFPSLSHQAIGTHAATDYGVHTFTAPPAHGTAGTVTHSVTQPDDHTISGHDTVLSLPVYFALAFIQRMQ